jgi:hypothetical protein
MQELITSHFNKNNVLSTAIYSPCKKYRYSLTRASLNSEASVLFILLNPSTATEITNDPTVLRCQVRANMLGYQSFRVCNLFAFRTKTPKIMKNYPNPVGPQNDIIIQESILWATQVICAWGNHGNYLNRNKDILEMIAMSGVKAYHLGLTEANQPRHPLYLSYSQKLVRWI